MFFNDEVICTIGQRKGILMNYRLRFTVFTPTYNRLHTLDRLYRSLQRQTFRDFEWVVVDDGSTDGTEQWFHRIQGESDFFQIKYYRVENGGKHRAINKGVKIAEGEMFFIADSDDYLTDDSLEIVDRVEKSIPNEDKKNFAGVCGLDVYQDGTLVGSTFNKSKYLDITCLQAKSNNICGDRKEVFYTSVLSLFPFPEFDGENFICEGLIWHRMAMQGYILRYFNIPIYIVEYQDSGISSNIDRVYKQSPKGWALTIQEDIKYGNLSGKEIQNTYLWYYTQMKDIISASDICSYLGISRSLLFMMHLKKRIKSIVKKIQGLFAL